MAPEQKRGGTVSAATDVWGIGAVLREAGLEHEGSLREDPAERPTVADVLRWLHAVESPRAPHPQPAA
jgi:hypothetical protein